MFLKSLKNVLYFLRSISIGLKSRLELVLFFFLLQITNCARFLHAFWKALKFGWLLVFVVTRCLLDLMEKLVARSTASLFDFSRSRERCVSFGSLSRNPSTLEQLTCDWNYSGGQNPKTDGKYNRVSNVKCSPHSGAKSFSRCLY